MGRAVSPGRALAGGPPVSNDHPSAGAVPTEQPIRYELDRPVDHEGGTIVALTFQQICGAHVRLVGVPPSNSRRDVTDWFLRLAALSANVPDEVIDKLSAHDAMQVVAIVQPMTGPSQGTGERRSSRSR